MDTDLNQMIARRGEDLQKVKSLNKSLDTLHNFNILCMFSNDEDNAGDIINRINIVKAKYMTDINLINDKLLNLTKDDWATVSEKSQEALQYQRNI